MSEHDRVAAKLLEPMADEYAPTAADRDRVRAKLRNRLGAAVLPAAAATTSVWAARYARGSVVGIGGVVAVLALGTLLATTLAPSSRTVAEATPPPEAVVAPERAALPAAPSVAAPGVAAPGVAAPSVAAPSVAAPGAGAPSEAPAVSVDALPTAAPEPTAHASAPPREATGAGRAADEDALVRETRLMASANEARRRGDLSGALALFERHAQEFPAGVLADERAVSRILVLCGLGRRSEASSYAEQFLNDRAPSPLTRRIESSCARPVSSDPHSTPGAITR